MRVTLYGLFRVTRRGYLFMQGVTALGMAILCVVAYILWRDQEALAASPREAWQVHLLRWASRNLFWVILVLAACAVLETLLVLRRFRRKEAERAARKPGTPA